MFRLRVCKEQTTRLLRTELLSFQISDKSSDINQSGKRRQEPNFLKEETGTAIPRANQLRSFQTERNSILIEGKKKTFLFFTLTDRATNEQSMDAKINKNKEGKSQHQTSNNKT